MIDLSKISIHFQAALGFLVLALIFAGIHLLQEPILVVWVAAATLVFGLCHVLAWLAGIVAVVALIVGIFARPEDTIGDRQTASATVDDEADLAPETRVHVERKQEWEQRPSEVVPFPPVPDKLN